MQACVSRNSDVPPLKLGRLREPCEVGEGCLSHRSLPSVLGRAVVVVDLPSKDLVRSWRKGLRAAVRLGECQGHFGRFIKGLATSLGIPNW